MRHYSTAETWMSIAMVMLDPLDMNQHRSSGNLWQMDSPTGDNWHGIQESLASALDKFRQKYRYVLIDCPSLRETHDAVRLSPLADGIIVAS